MISVQSLSVGPAVASDSNLFKPLLVSASPFVSRSKLDGVLLVLSCYVIWKPIPVRIFYTFVIYQGYDMDILSGKSYDVIYRGYDMDIPNANNLERDRKSVV